MEIGKKYATISKIGSSVVLKNMDYGVKVHVAKTRYAIEDAVSKILI